MSDLLICCHPPLLVLLYVKFHQIFSYMNCKASISTGPIYQWNCLDFPRHESGKRAKRITSINILIFAMNRDKCHVFAGMKLKILHGVCGWIRYSSSTLTKHFFNSAVYGDPPITDVSPTESVPCHFDILDLIKSIKIYQVVPFDNDMNQNII